MYTGLMGWMKHIDQVINDSFRSEAPPADGASMAHILRGLGHNEAAHYVERLDEVAYDDIKWRIELQQMNRADAVQNDDKLTDVELDEMYEEYLSTRESGYQNYDYDHAHSCK